MTYHNRCTAALLTRFWSVSETSLSICCVCASAHGPYQTIWCSEERKEQRGFAWSLLSLNWHHKLHRSSSWIGRERTEIQDCIWSLLFLHYGTRSIIHLSQLLSCELNKGRISSSFKLSIHQGILKKISPFPQKLWTTVFNIDKTKKKFFSSKPAYYNYFWRIVRHWRLE